MPCPGIVSRWNCSPLLRTCCLEVHARPMLSLFHGVSLECDLSFRVSCLVLNFCNTLSGRNIHSGMRIEFRNISYSGLFISSPELVPDNHAHAGQMYGIS